MANPVTETEKAIVRALQQDLPLVPEPYRVVAESLGRTEEALLDGIQGFMRKGQLKRISIALRHKNVGYKVNVMVVWDVPDDRIHDVGMRVSAHPAVTHCYKRNRSEKFPYNFYTMVHARSDEEYNQVIAELVEIIGSEVPHDVSFEGLRSMRELKKVGMKYFLEKPEDMIEE